VKGLKLKANLAADATFTNNRNFEVKISDQFRKNSYNQLTLKNDKYWAILQEYFLSYDKHFGNHALVLLGGYTSQTFNDLYSATRGRDFASEAPELRYMRYAGSIVALAEAMTEAGATMRFSPCLDASTTLLRPLLAHRYVQGRRFIKICRRS